MTYRLSDQTIIDAIEGIFAKYDSDRNGTL